MRSPLLAVQDDAPEGLCSKFTWFLSNTAHRRTVGNPSSEGKVYIRCYNGIYKHDMDMLLPGSKPNPAWMDILFVVVPFLAGFGAAIYKIVSVRCYKIVGGIAHQVGESSRPPYINHGMYLLLVHSFYFEPPQMQCSCKS